MSRAASEKRPAAARDRILEAALDTFAVSAYEKAGLREVGRIADADVAYVHRSFGSKKKLFARALELATGSGRPGAVATAELPLQLSVDVFRDLQAAVGEGPRLLDLLSQSLSSPDVSDIVGQAVSSGLIEPLAARLDGEGRERAVLIAALLCGMGVFCKVLHRDLLPEAEREGLRRELVATIEHLMGEAVPAAAADG